MGGRRVVHTLPRMVHTEASLVAVTRGRGGWTPALSYEFVNQTRFGGRVVLAEFSRVELLALHAAITEELKR